MLGAISQPHVPRPGDEMLIEVGVARGCDKPPVGARSSPSWPLIFQCVCGIISNVFARWDVISRLPFVLGIHLLG